MNLDQEAGIALGQDLGNEKEIGHILEEEYIGHGQVQEKEFVPLHERDIVPLQEKGIFHRREIFFALPEEDFVQRQGKTSIPEVVHIERKVVKVLLMKVAPA